MPRGRLLPFIFQGGKNMEYGSIIEHKIEITLMAENETDMKKLKDDMKFILASFERKTVMNHRKVRVIIK